MLSEIMTALLHARKDDAALWLHQVLHKLGYGRDLLHYRNLARAYARTGNYGGAVLFYKDTKRRGQRLEEEVFDVFVRMFGRSGRKYRHHAHALFAG
jgi:hypothetical protein